MTTTNDTGATAITSYEIYWDNGGSSFAELAGVTSDLTSTSYTKTGITAGTSYKFKIRAKNALGVGAYSPELTVVPSSAPAQINPVNTTVEYLYIKIAWDEPDNRGDAITAYKVFIKDGSGNYQEETNYCANSDSLVTNKYCTIFMALALHSPLSLTKGSNILAKVQAYNSKGWSTLSNENTAVVATVETEPAVV